MDKLAHAYAIFVSVIAPWLVASLIPSLIVGLTPYPKASKTLQVLSAVGKFLGFLTHKDEPGTLQAPVLSSLMRMHKSSAAAALAFVMLFSGTAGCAAYARWRQAHPTAAAVVDCAKDSVVSSIPAIIADVFAALSGGSPDWKALGDLEAAHGVDAVVCAAGQVMAQAGSVSGDSSTAPAMRRMASRVGENAAAYIKSRHVQLQGQ